MPGLGTWEHTMPRALQGVPGCRRRGEHRCGGGSQCWLLRWNVGGHSGQRPHDASWCVLSRLCVLHLRTSSTNFTHTRPAWAGVGGVCFSSWEMGREECKFLMP